MSSCECDLRQGSRHQKRDHEPGDTAGCKEKEYPARNEDVVVNVKPNTGAGHSTVNSEAEEDGRDAEELQFTSQPRMSVSGLIVYLHSRLWRALVC